MIWPSKRVPDMQNDIGISPFKCTLWITIDLICSARVCGFCQFTPKSPKKAIHAPRIQFSQKVFHLSFSHIHDNVYCKTAESGPINFFFTFCFSFTHTVRPLGFFPHLSYVSLFTIETWTQVKIKHLQEQTCKNHNLPVWATFYPSGASCANVIHTFFSVPRDTKQKQLKN